MHAQLTCATCFATTVRIVRIISPWAISHTSALNRGWAYIRITIGKRPIRIQDLRADGPIIDHGLIIRTIRYQWPRPQTSR